MEAFDICDKLLSQRGHFYVCGDVSMAEDVCRTLQVIPLCLSIVKFSYTVRVVEAPANREFKIRSPRTTDYGNTRRGPGLRFTAHAR